MTSQRSTRSDSGRAITKEKMVTVRLVEFDGHPDDGELYEDRCKMPTISFQCVVSDGHQDNADVGGIEFSVVSVPDEVCQ